MKPLAVTVRHTTERKGSYIAKGDHQRQQNQLDYQGGTTQNNLDNLRTNLTRQNQGLENRFNVTADRGEQDYNNLQGLSGNYLNSVVNGPTQNFGAYGGYQNFANTGGYSPDDISNIRARSVAPMRAVYQNAQNDINRQRSLQGGYSPNYTAASAKMARELGYGLADASTNTEAALADQIRQGKLSGLGGMTNIDSALLNSQTQRMGIGSDVLRNMMSLYGQAPGMAQLFGNQMLNSSGQGVQIEGLQNDIMKNYLQGQNNVANTTGNWQSAMGNIGSTIGAVGDVGNVFNPYSFGSNAGTDLATRPYGPGY